MRLTVTYMEMTAAPSSPLRSSPHGNLSIAREPLSREAYLALYSAIGAPLQWDARLRMPAAALDTALSRPSNHCYVLREDGEPVGLAEFIDVGRPDVELLHFGLVAGAQGRGLGGYFLDRALRAVWAHSPARIWLHTDTNDSAAAIPVYAKAGFRSYLTREEDFPD